MDKKFVSKRMQNENLSKDQVKLIAIRPTDTEKVQLVFLQKMEREGRVNLLGALNKGDDRFNQSNGARPFWVTATIEGVEAMFGADIASKAKQAKESEDYVSLDVLNPTDVNGREVAIQINETHRARTAEMNDLNRLKLSAKQDGYGNYLGKKGDDGKYYAIFERQQLTYKDVMNHQFIQHETTTKDVEDLELEYIQTQEPDTEEDEKASSAQKQDKELTGQPA